MLPSLDWAYDNAGMSRKKHNWSFSEIPSICIEKRNSEKKSTNSRSNLAYIKSMMCIYRKILWR